MKDNNEKLLNGLTQSQANERLKKYGYNDLEVQKSQTLLEIILEILKEPMFILLIASALIYFFVSKEVLEGLIMIFSVVLMIAIDVVQQYKTDKSLEKLREMSSPKAIVKRDGKFVEIESSCVVPGDVMQITEGDKVCADGRILSLSDLAVDESVLTGESDIIYKTLSDDGDGRFKQNYVYQGTSVVLGSAEILVTETGSKTQVGQIGQSILDAPSRPTPLEKQVNGLVKKVSSYALIMLVIVVIITYFQFHDFYKSIISGLTFAISTIPEEFPVILTIFLSLGAYRLSAKKSLIRRLSSVETLGCVSVLCVDKTGTLTENKMTVSKILPFGSCSTDYIEKISVLACEKNSYDPMEKAILKHCKINSADLFLNELITEYPFTSKLKMMGHVWKIQDKIITAVKGSPEGVLKICKLTESKRELILKQQAELASDGCRVIAVAAKETSSLDSVPSNIEDCELDFIGFISLSDPPRKEVKKSIDVCKKAGIKVIMITGDNPITAKAIGKQIGFSDYNNFLTGDQIDSMSEEELTEAVKNTNIFARVVPEQKLKIIKAIKQNGLTVAMTGDGVNDAPALKYADIGIAMGKRGTSIAKEASDMILLDDNFSTIVETVKDGRRIYDNIQKAVRYVLTFKVPVILISLFVPLMGLSPMLLPIHIVLLELILDPVSAIVLERQPAEKNIMSKKPRDVSKKLISLKDIVKIIFQGLIIFLSAFSSYVTIFSKFGDEALARSFSISILILSNILLIYINSSDTQSMFYVMKTFVKDKIILTIICFILAMLGLILYFEPMRIVFKTSQLNLWQLITVIMISIISVIWYEVVKTWNHSKEIKKNNT